MKRLLIILILACYSAIAGSPPNNAVTILRNKPENPYLRLFEAVSQVESSNDPFAFNPRENSYGIVQIREIRLRDYRKRTGKNYSLTDMYNPDISREIFLFYASKYKANEYETIARNWNGRYSKTKGYWLKVKAVLI